MSSIRFTNANLLDGVHPARPQTTVVVEGERITVVEAGAGAPEAGEVVIDLDGRTLMPGMASCHFHATYHDLGAKPAPFGLEEPPALQAVRAVRNLESVLRAGFTSAVSAGAPFAIDPALRRAINEGAGGTALCPREQGRVDHRPCE